MVAEPSDNILTLNLALYSLCSGDITNCCFPLGQKLTIVLSTRAGHAATLFDNLYLSQCIFTNAFLRRIMCPFFQYFLLAFINQTHKDTCPVDFYINIKEQIIQS